MTAEPRVLGFRVRVQGLGFRVCAQEALQSIVFGIKIPTILVFGPSRWQQQTWFAGLMVQGSWSQLRSFRVSVVQA